MARNVARWILAIAYAIAGVLHLIKPHIFIAITPAWVPDPSFVIAATGVAEIAGAIGLLIPRRWIAWARPAAGASLALYALCVWPANINHAVNHIAIGGETLGWGYHGPRMLLQPILIWLGMWVGGVIDWPFRKNISGDTQQPIND